MEKSEETGIIRSAASPESQPGGQGGGGDGAYVTNLRRRQVNTYAVTEDELTSIDTQYWQASAALSLAFLLVGVVLNIILTGGAAEKEPLLYSLSTVSLAFGGFGIWLHRTRKSLLNRIKDQAGSHAEDARN